jgi:hypothetical protein
MQTHAYFAIFTVREVNAGLFEGFLNLEHGGEVSFHNSIILLNPLKRRSVARPTPAAPASLA